ncbi:MAG TPA: NADPH-dependent F420 reductase [Acidimicrobiales bacterium]|nr:NADPH-dependent F420 reductase [Acidimicrobiales bacterium]
MRVGILGGTGPAGSALAVRLASVGQEVVIGSRSAERAEGVCAELRGRWPDHSLSLSGADNAGAARSDVVVVATPWDAAASTAASVAGELEGRVVVSMANALAKVGDELQALMPARGSVAEAVQAAVPAARVAAAFHHVPARELGEIDSPVHCDVIVCADDPAAAEAAAGLVDLVPGCSPVHAGSLSAAAAVEAFTAVILQVNRRYRTRATLRLVGLPDQR